MLCAKMRARSHGAGLKALSRLLSQISTRALVGKRHNQQHRRGGIRRRDTLQVPRESGDLRRRGERVAGEQLDNAEAVKGEVTQALLEATIFV